MSAQMSAQTSAQMSAQTSAQTSAPQARRGGAVRRTARWATNLAILAVLVACAAWIVPSFFGISRYVITGGSMTGTYDKGSVVFEKPVPVADLAVGDVITYLPPAESGLTHLVTHRIIDVQQAQGGGLLFTTQGDANPSRDPWQFTLLNGEQPVVRYAVPHVGWVFIALADRQVRMLAIGGPAALVALMALVELVGAVRSGRRGSEAAAAVPAPATSRPLATRLPSQRSGPDLPDHAATPAPLARA